MRTTNDERRTTQPKASALFFCLILLLLPARLHAFESYVLPNGLEVFVEERHQVPLVNIRITFRAGAIVETEQLNGLCHVYEHMLFKGNRTYGSQEEFMAAMKRLGVGNWNGGTSTEYVTYFFTIPSDRLADGLLFWAAAMQTPLLREDELVKERQVVHNEIAGKQAEPEYVLHKAERHALYPDYWFRRDVSGDLAVIDAATVRQLRFIKETFYVPNNAALFISGDVRPEATARLVKKFFGGWMPGSGFPVLQPHRPLPGNRWVVVDNSPTQGLVQVRLVFRGPDTAADADATYAADVWGQLVNNPEGRFKNALLKAVPELYGGTRYISAGYFTQRDGGETSFSFTLRAPQDAGLWQSINRLRDAVMQEIDGMRGPDYFSPDELQAACRELENHEVLAREVPQNYMANLSFWWASTSTDYYMGYVERIRETTRKDVASYVEHYMHAAPFLTSVWLHPDDEAKQNIISRAARMQ